MDLMEIIGKAAAGEALSEAERARLADFRPGDAGSSELEKRNRELETRIEELEKSALTEPEQLKRRYDAELARLRESLESAGAGSIRSRPRRPGRSSNGCAKVRRVFSSSIWPRVHPRCRRPRHGPTGAGTTSCRFSPKFPP